jgi:hypothetical protein
MRLKPIIIGFEYACILNPMFSLSDRQHGAWGVPISRTARLPFVRRRRPFIMCPVAQEIGAEGLKQRIQSSAAADVSLVMLTGCLGRSSTRN